MTALIALKQLAAALHQRYSTYYNKMTLSWSSRVVRGGSAVQTVYWRATESPSAAKLVKHGRVLTFKQATPPPPLVHRKLETSSTIQPPAL